jgi:hypothetical protein
MTATCTITRDIGDGTPDGDGVWHPPTTTVVYTGRCRVEMPASASNPVVGEQRIGVETPTVAIEWDAAEVREHDTVTIVTARDPRLAGQRFQVVGVAYASEQFERLLSCTHNLTDREV